MDKRYQVFISSTYADLQDERQEVMQALLELDCIPAGMELFPAANEDQWTLIKRVIDDSDYYIVIVAGRYGSLGPDGLSFTEMEYRYALEKGKPVIGFAHREPDTLPVNQCEPGEEGKSKLAAFRGLVQKKLCRFWVNPSDLGSQVSRSLVKLTKDHPGIGWVRGNLVPDESAAQELLQLHKQIERLKAELQATRTSAPEGSSSLAQGSDKFEIKYVFTAKKVNTYHREHYTHSGSLEWDTIFFEISPLMIDEATEDDIAETLNKLICDKEYDKIKKLKKDMSFTDFKIDRSDFDTIKIQLRSLGLIRKSTKIRSVKDTATYWTLTPYGDDMMTRLRAIRRNPNATGITESVNLQSSVIDINDK